MTLSLLVRPAEDALGFLSSLVPATAVQDMKARNGYSGLNVSIVLLCQRCTQHRVYLLARRHSPLCFQR